MISANGANWLFALATSVAFAFIGLLVPNLYKQTKTPRPHNRHKFANEFLARHQLTYTTFFAAVALTADFQTGFEWIKKLFAFALATALGSYLIGVYFTVHQDSYFESHGCKEPGTCTTPMSLLQLLDFCKFNLAMSAILLLGAVALACAIK